VGEETYLVRYGVMAHVGRFFRSLDGGTPFQRGQLVVVETERGVELGEVLARVEATSKPARSQDHGRDHLDASDDSADLPRRLKAQVLRPATSDEIARLETAAQDRFDHLELCQRALQQFNWPWEVIDVETLLDDRTLVLHYLGPVEVDSAAIRAWFRTAHDRDAIFEPVGNAASSQPAKDAFGASSGHGCGENGCGHGGCDSGVEGGYSSVEVSGRTCGTSDHSGCSSCGIMRAMTEQRQRDGNRAKPVYAGTSAS
jgi:hypothetical protein